MTDKNHSRTGGGGEDTDSDKEGDKEHSMTGEAGATVDAWRDWITGTGDSNANQTPDDEREETDDGDATNG